MRMEPLPLWGSGSRIDLVYVGSVKQYMQQVTVGYFSESLVWQILGFEACFLGSGGYIGVKKPSIFSFVA